MKKTFSQLLKAFGEFLILALLMLLPAVMVYLDVQVRGRTITEYSFTELTQESLILAAAILFWISAFKQAYARGFLVLVAGFFACMFIREQDGLLDNISHGFWFYPAMLMAIGSVIYALRYHRTILGPMAEFTRSKPYVFIAIGLLIVLVFSRVFGSGNLLWKEVLGEDYTSFFKGVIQEGLELFGYIFIFYGACLYRYQASRLHDDADRTWER